MIFLHMECYFGRVLWPIGMSYMYETAKGLEIEKWTLILMV